METSYAHVLHMVAMWLFTRKQFADTVVQMVAYNETCMGGLCYIVEKTESGKRPTLIQHTIHAQHDRWLELKRQMKHSCLPQQPASASQDAALTFILCFSCFSLDLGVPSFIHQTMKALSPSLLPSSIMNRWHGHLAVFVAML